MRGLVYSVNRALCTYLLEGITMKDATFTTAQAVTAIIEEKSRHGASMGAIGLRFVKSNGGVCSLELMAKFSAEYLERDGTTEAGCKSVITNIRAYCRQAALPVEYKRANGGKTAPKTDAERKAASRAKAKAAKAKPETKTDDAAPKVIKFSDPARLWQAVDAHRATLQLLLEANPKASLAIKSAIEEFADAILACKPE